MTALGGWSRGVHWSSPGTARSGAGTESADAWTESHSGVVLGVPGVSAIELCALALGIEVAW